MSSNDAKRKLKKWHKQKGKCDYCGKDMLKPPFMDYISNRKERQKKAATWDHIIPIAHCGSNKPFNKKLVCGECNQLKNTLSLKEFESFMENAKKIL